MEESTQQPLLEAVKTLSSVTTSALNDLQRSNEHMISMANRLSTLEDSLMLNRLPSPVVTQNETIAPDNYVSAQRLDVQDSRRDTINPEDMEELKRQLDRISKDIKEKRSTPTCNPPPRDPEENYDRTLETCSSPKATSTPGVCQEIPYCMEEDPENWAPTQTSAFTGHHNLTGPYGQEHHTPSNHITPHLEEEGPEADTEAEVPPGMRTAFTAVPQITGPSNAHCHPGEGPRDPRVLTALDTEVRGAQEGDHLEEAAAVANLPCQSDASVRWDPCGPVGSRTIVLKLPRVPC
ncbi:Cysteate synthase, partial [Dissostichus eleginoides]